MRTGFGEEGHQPMFMASGPGSHGPSRNDRLAVETTACIGSDFAFGSGDYEIATRAAKFLADNREAESIKSTMETTTAWMTKARRDDMIDTGFHVPETKLTRLVAPPPGGRLAVWDVTKAPALFSGGGGLVSTVRDYLQFCRMLLKNGELNGVRILSPQTVKRMTSNALPADIRFANEMIEPALGATWGLGFAITTDPTRFPGSIGSVSWSGVWGTFFWIDFTENIKGLSSLEPGRGRSASGKFVAPIPRGVR